MSKPLPKPTPKPLPLTHPQEGDDPQTYAAAWKRYAVRYNLARTLLYGLVPAYLTLFLLSRHWLHRPMTFLLIMFLWIPATLFAVWWAGEFRCPRCRRRFASLGFGGHAKLTRGLFEEICSNCKLKKFEQ